MTAPEPAAPPATTLRPSPPRRLHSPPIGTRRPEPRIDEPAPAPDFPIGRDPARTRRAPGRRHVRLRRAGAREFRCAMDTFRAEMQRLAERQSHVEGRIDERHGAGVD